MVKITKTPKNQMKQKKMAPPPKKFEESEEEESSDLDESSGEEMIPQKKPQKVAVTPAKKAATPAKKVATPAKKAITPAKKVVATPQPKKAVTPTPKKAAVLTKGAKNGKNAKKQESEEDDEDDEDDDEEDEEDSDEEEEPPMPVKPAAKKPAAVPAKKPAAVPAKQDSEEDEDEDDDEEDDEEDESEDEAMDTAPVPVKKPTPAKAAPVKAKAAESEDEEDEDDDEDDDEEEEDEEDAEEESEDEKPVVKEAPGKRKKEMANKSAPEPKKKKTDGPTSAFTVFVGNLVSTKDFEELKTGLREFFGKKNIEVLDVRIGATRRFGYVDFSSAEELDKALQMNGKKLMGVEVKLEKAKSKETIKENKKERDARTLFLKNLPYRITEDDIREVFENAVEVRIVMNKDGNSKGMAYVEFKTEAEADKALEEKQGTEIEGRAVVIDFTGEKSQQENQKGESSTLIVNNLSYAATEETLQEVFKKASSIKVPQNNQGRPKGYAFVDFATAEDAREALNSLNNTEIEGRTIRLEFSSPSWQKGNTNARGGGGFNQQSKTLFVRGLSEDTTEETLRESFEGSISARIVTDRDTGSSKGFGFVDFSSAEDAKAAKEAMEDGEIDGNKVTLDFAKPKGDFQRGGGFGGRGGRGGGRGGRGGFGGRGGGRGGFGGRGGGFRGGRGGGGDHKPQGKKIKFE
ncbi:Nucleolin [Lonchura striata]|uniref:Nucleolin n=1 Tax=Lonchura striata TaxID=40157 RepID=A0A218UWJ6_9PASE|nr:nucleolin [Lonchura striata domestica]OWK58018.1 Nucleolin [Lonchura striata domestica]